MKLLVILAAALAATSATRASTLDTKNARVLDPVGYLHYFQSQSLVEKEDSTNNLNKEGSETSAGPMITIDDFGRAQGKYLTSFLGRQFSSFRGIPYANKPERFQVRHQEVKNNVMNKFVNASHINLVGTDLCIAFIINSRFYRIIYVIKMFIVIGHRNNV